MSKLTLLDLGVTSEETSVLPREQVQMLAAALDVTFGPTLPLPLLWHWVYFNPVVSTAALGPDGHPVRESPLLADFPRRMWVGGDVRAEGLLRTDKASVRCSDTPAKRAPLVTCLWSPLSTSSSKTIARSSSNARMSSIAVRAASRRQREPRRSRARCKGGGRQSGRIQRCCFGFPR
jgi:hypothetical protein